MTPQDEAQVLREARVLRETLDANVIRLGNNLAAAKTDEEFEAAEKEALRFVVDLLRAWVPGKRMGL